MKTTTKRIATSAAAVVAVGAIVAGAWGFSTAVSATPEPTPTPTAEVATYVGTDENGLAGEQESEGAAAEAARVEAERIAAEAAEAAAAEAARIAAEQEAARVAQDLAAQQQTVTTPSPGGSGDQPTTNARVRCPAGTLANSSDGYNDTSCLAEICFNIAVPDPAHPECDQAFRP